MQLALHLLAKPRIRKGIDSVRDVPLARPTARIKCRVSGTVRRRNERDQPKRQRSNRGGTCMALTMSWYTAGDQLVCRWVESEELEQCDAAPTLSDGVDRKGSSLETSVREPELA